MSNEGGATGDPMAVTTAEPIMDDDSQVHYYPTVQLSDLGNLEKHHVNSICKEQWIGNDRLEEEEDDEQSHQCDSVTPQPSINSSTGSNVMMMLPMRKRTLTTDSSVGGESEHEQFSQPEATLESVPASSSTRPRLCSLEEVTVDDEQSAMMMNDHDDAANLQHHQHPVVSDDEEEDNNHEEQEPSEELLAAPSTIASGSQRDHSSINSRYQDHLARSSSPQVVIASVLSDVTATTNSNSHGDVEDDIESPYREENPVDHSRRQPSNDNNSSDPNIEVVAVAQPIHIPGIDDSFRSDLEMGDQFEPYDQPYTYYIEQQRLRHHHHNMQISGTSTDPLPSLDEVPGASRPEYMSATVHKQQKTERLGVRLCHSSMILERIDRSQASLLRDCPFRPGNKLVSINNKRTESMDLPATAARMLREATGYITLVVHNPRPEGVFHDGTDPYLVEAMITKSHKHQRSGMGLKSSGIRDLRISSINENGLFAHSILNVGDRILSINGTDVSEVDARVACDIIKNAPQHVTILARTRHNTAVVVAEVSSRGNMLEALAALPAMRRGYAEIEAWDDTLLRDKRKREQFMLFLAMLITMGVIFSSVFGATARGVAMNEEVEAAENSNGVYFPIVANATVANATVANAKDTNSTFNNSTNYDAFVKDLASNTTSTADDGVGK